MGDGRYYTTYQFLDVLMALVVAALAVFSLVYSHYRKNKHNPLYICFAMGLIISVLRVFESVLPNLVLCAGLRRVQIVLLCALIVQTARIGKNPKTKPLIAVTAALGLLALWAPLIHNYRFHHIQYTLFAKLLITCAVLYTALSLKLNRTAFWCVHLPAAVTLIAVYTEAPIVDYAELLLLGGVTLYQHMRFKEAAYTLRAFNRVGDMGSSAIIVLDAAGRCVYKNHAAKSFASNASIDLEHLDAVFNSQEVQVVQRGGKTPIAVALKDGIRYYDHSVTPLKDRTGHILTFTDITDLMALLDTLETKKKQAEAAHAQLSGYAKVAYHVEKEKAINRLLEAVVGSREKQMVQLAQKIETAGAHIGEAAFERAIEAAMAESNALLASVRDTVTQYRAYYGG